jgi:hypothetical protein
MKRLVVLFAATAALSLSACGSSSSSPPPVTPFPRPTGYVAVTFQVDDTANKVFANNELGWKGQMSFAETNRIVTVDDTWTGPFANLYDDGPWDAGGHEAPGEVAGDHKFGAVVFVKPPTAAGTNTTISYGLQDNVYQTNYGNGWNWPYSSNGSFVVFAGQTADVTAQKAVLPAFGTIHFKLELDTNALTPPDGGGTWNLSKVAVKGTATTWAEVNVLSSGVGGVYNLDLATVVGAGKTFYHSGLLKSGDKPEWVWVLNGVEYKAGGTAATGGVKAYTRANTTAAWAEQTVGIAANNNTYITVP